MPVIEVVTEIAAPPGLVFDLARSIDFHVETQARHAERVVAGRTTGLIELGESVTWEAVHFGVRQRLTSKITVFARPDHFRDEMTHGVFAYFVHDHHFHSVAAGTRMVDVLDYAAPLGPLGRIAERVAVTRHLRRLLTDRAQLVRDVAQGWDDDAAAKFSISG